MMNILIYLDNFDGNSPPPAVTDPDRLGLVVNLFHLLSHDLNINMKNNSTRDDSDEDKLNHVIIKNGELVQGRIDSKILNTGTEVLFTDFSTTMVLRNVRTLDDLQNIVHRYLVISGFSVGIGDLVAK